MQDGYKTTDIGVFPSDWEVLPLSYGTLLLKSGLSRRLSESDIGIPCLRTNCITQNNKLSMKDLKYWYLQDPQGSRISDYVIDEGDLLVGFINSIAQIGKCCIYKKYHRPVIYTTNIFRLKTNMNLLPYYFLLFSQTETYRTQILSITKPAVNQASFTTGDFKNILIPFPPLPEQQKIADILTTVDDHISETESLIEKTKELKQGLMQQLLTKGIGHSEFKDTEIGKIPVEWEVGPFKSVVFFQEGPGLRNWQYTDSGMPFLNIRCLQNGAVDRKNIQYISAEEFNNKYQHFALNKGDIVVSSSGTLGKKAIIKESDLPIMLNTSIIRLRSNDTQRLDMGFLNYYVESDHYQKAVLQESVGSAQANYGPYHLSRINILLPPLQEQHQIASILSTVDDQIDTYQAKLTSLTSLKTGLMQQLLTGKIRVKV